MAITPWWQRGNPQAQPAAAQNPQARPQTYQSGWANTAMNRGTAAGQLPYWKDGIPNNNPNGPRNFSMPAAPLPHTPTGTPRTGATQQPMPVGTNPYWNDGVRNNNPNGPNNFSMPAQGGPGNIPRYQQPAMKPPPPQGGYGGYGYESGGGYGFDDRPGQGPPPTHGWQNVNIPDWVRESRGGGRDFRVAPQGRGAQQPGRGQRLRQRSRPVRLGAGRGNRQQGQAGYRPPAEGATEAHLRQDALDAGVPDSEVFNLEADENWIGARRQLDSELYQALAANNMADNEIERAMALLKERIAYRHGLDMQEIDQGMEDRGLFNSGIRTDARQKRNVDYTEQWQDASAEALQQRLNIQRRNAQAWQDYIRAQQEGLLDLSDSYYDEPPGWIGEGDNGYTQMYDDEVPGGQRKPKPRQQQRGKQQSGGRRRGTPAKSQTNKRTRGTSRGKAKR